MLCTSLTTEKGHCNHTRLRGAALSLEGNRRVKGHIILGTFYVVAVKDGRLRSLTDSEITKYMSQFWEPELFTEDEVTESWFYELELSL